MIKEAVPQGVELHTIIMETVRSFISKALVCGTSSFLYVSLPEDDKHIVLFQLPVVISCLARYTLEIYVRGLSVSLNKIADFIFTLKKYHLTVPSQKIPSITTNTARSMLKQR